MALPLAKTELPEEPTERIFRPVEGEDGKVRVLQIVPTRDDLLNPRLEDELTQSNDHLLTLVPLFDTLKRYLKRLAPNLSVFSDLMLLYKRHGYPHDRNPDIAVIEGLPEDLEVHRSLDVIGEGGRLRLAIEIVSTSSRRMLEKDEDDNMRLYAQLGVEDYVMVYPGAPGRPLTVVAQRLGGSRPFWHYVPNPPDPEGRIDLRSVGLWLSVEPVGLGRPVLVHQATGQRLLSAEEEEQRAEEAERQTADLLVALLTARGVEMDDESRFRISSCKDPQQLRRWTERAMMAARVEDLWND